MLKGLRTSKPNIFFKYATDLVSLLEIPVRKDVLTEYCEEVSLRRLVFRWAPSKWTSLSNSGAKNGPVSEIFADPMHPGACSPSSKCYDDLRKKVEIYCCDTLLSLQLFHFCSNHASIRKSCTLNQESRIGCVPVSPPFVDWIKQKMEM